MIKLSSVPIASLRKILICAGVVPAYALNFSKVEALSCLDGLYVFYMLGDFQPLYDFASSLGMSFHQLFSLDLFNHISSNSQ